MCGGCQNAPGIGKTALTAAKAFSRVAVAFASGNAVKAKRETIEARHSICMSCEFCKPWEVDESFHRCMKCGCWLDGKYFAKLEIATESCPVGKWVAG